MTGGHALALATALAALVTLAPADVRSLDDCPATVAAAPENFEAYRCFWLQGRAQKRLDDAAARLAGYLAIDPANAGALLYLGLVQVDRQQPGSLDLFLRAVDAFVARGDEKGEVYARISAFYGLRFAGRAVDAEAQLDLAERAAEHSGIAELPVRVLVERGWLALGRDDFGRAYALFRAAHDRMPEEVPPDLPGRLLGGLGAAARWTQRGQESADAYRAQAEFYRRVGNRFDEAMARTSLVGLDLSLLSREDRAKRAAEAYEFAKSVGNRSAEMQALRFLADFSVGPEARRLRQELVSLVRDSHYSREQLVPALGSLAFDLFHFEPKDVSGALSLLDEAISFARSRGLRIHEIRARSTRGAGLIGSGRPVEGRVDILASIAAFESLRDAQPAETTRRRVAAEGRWVFDRNALAILGASSTPSAEDLALAFEISERMRAGSVRDDLDPAANSPELAEWESTLAAIVQAQRRLVDPALADGERSAALAELEGLETREIEAREQLARAEVAAGRSRRAQLAALDDVWSALGPRRALVSFVYDTGFGAKGVALVVTAGGDHAFWLDADWNEIRRAVELFRSLVLRGDGSESTAASRLYGELLAPALGVLPPEIEELIIVPDLALSFLPFDLLRASEQQPLLGERYAITIAPSASAWLAAVNLPPAAGDPAVLVLADPAWDAGPRERAESRDWSVLGAANLGALPFARREGRVAAGLSAASVVREGAEASEHYLKGTDLSRFGIVHFAAHGVVDTALPERSAILLSPGDPAEDGLLQVREIPRLDLGGSTVILSACRSGSGELLAGQGIVGLADAFLRARSRAVVATLWAVRDDQAAALIEAFYRRLARGGSVAAALAGAKHDRRTAGDPGAGWAAFTLIGDGSWVPYPGGAKRRWVAALAWTIALAVAALGTWFWRSRRSVA